LNTNCRLVLLHFYNKLTIFIQKKDKIVDLLI
jgi:hypothetical protein